MKIKNKNFRARFTILRKYRDDILNFKNILRVRSFSLITYYYLLFKNISCKNAIYRTGQQNKKY